MKPTLYLPGTEKKIQIMRYRVEFRLPLFHPQDARWDYTPVLEPEEEEETVEDH